MKKNNLVKLLLTSLISISSIGSISTLSTSCEKKEYSTIIYVTDVTLDSSSITLSPNKTKQLTATVYPEDATDKSVTWSSDNENVATVNQDGLVTAHLVGETIITATTNNGKTST